MEKISDFKGAYGFLSNFHSSPVTFGGLTYPNAESAFQAQKCATEEAKLKYTQKRNPLQVKGMGKREPGLRADWNEVAYDVMLEVTRAKYANSTLAEKLLATGDAYLEEGNHWHDNRWGRCTCEKCRDKQALNWLGKILMQVREELREKQ